MDKKHHGRYFVIDTNPSVHYQPPPPDQRDDNRDYESDTIDEEIEHRLYSLIHHASTDNASGDSIELSGQFVKPSNRLNKPVDITEAHQVTAVINISGSSNKRRRENSSDPSPKKSKQIDYQPSTSSINSCRESNQVTQNQSTTIYLSDSDDDVNIESEAIGEKRDLWHIDYKDILISNPIHGKFYRPRIWCSRCRKEGNHPVKLCHLPKHKICFICGNIGHLGQHCKNQHCKRCMDFHPTSKCNLNVRDFQCRICSKYGHLDDACPNHWRKFHNITDPQVDPDTVNINIVKNKKKYCSICGRHQHYSFECERLRFRSIEVSSPYDINTSFGGNSHSARNKPTSTSSQQRKQRQELPSSPSKFQRRSASRYFTSEHNSQEIIQPSQNCTTINNQANVTSPRGRKKEARKQKRKKKVDQASEAVNSLPGIRVGRVNKSKIKQQQKKKLRKASKNGKPSRYGALNIRNSDLMIGYRR